MGRPRGSKNKSKELDGLGTDIKKALQTFGVDKVVKSVFPDCGCEKREFKANISNAGRWYSKIKELFLNAPTKKYEMNEEIFTWYHNFKSRLEEPNNPTREDVAYLENIYKVVTHTYIKGCESCSGTSHVVKTYIHHIDIAYNDYLERMEKKLKEDAKKSSRVQREVITT